MSRLGRKVIPAFLMAGMLMPGFSASRILPRCIPSLAPQRIIDSVLAEAQAKRDRKKNRKKTIA